MILYTVVLGAACIFLQRPDRPTPSIYTSCCRPKRSLSDAAAELAMAGAAAWGAESGKTKAVSAFSNAGERRAARRASAQRDDGDLGPGTASANKALGTRLCRPGLQQLSSPFLVSWRRLPRVGGSPSNQSMTDSSSSTDVSMASAASVTWVGRYSTLWACQTRGPRNTSAASGNSLPFIQGVCRSLSLIRET